MIGYADSLLAWGLTRGMARLLGVNLATAVVDGWLSRRELGQLVDRCEACSQKEACTAWLATAAGSSCPPVFCPNKSAIEGLSLQH